MTWTAPTGKGALARRPLTWSGALVEEPARASLRRHLHRLDEAREYAVERGHRRRLRFSAARLVRPGDEERLGPVEAAGALDLRARSAVDVHLDERAVVHRGLQVRADVLGRSRPPSAGELEYRSSRTSTILNVPRGGWSGLAVLSAEYWYWPQSAAAAADCRAQPASAPPAIRATATGAAARRAQDENMVIFAALHFRTISTRRCDGSILLVASPLPCGVDPARIDVVADQPGATASALRWDSTSLCARVPRPSV